MSETNHNRGALIRPIATLLVAFLTPVCATLAQGGADWEISESIRLSWYGQWIAWPMLGTVSVLTLWRPRRSGAAEDLVLAGSIALIAATSILWTGGARLPFISFRSPDTSAWIGLISITLASLRGLRLTKNAARWTAGLVAALLLGLLLQTALMRLDAARIAIRLPDSSTLSDHSAVQTALGRSKDPHRPDVLWIVADTLRADALGVYRETAAGRGHTEPDGEMPRTPFLDDLAGRSIVFERVMSTAPWTLPSMMSVFTSRWPSTLDPQGRGRARRIEELIGLDPELPTWIDVFRDAGYHTAGFQKNPFLGHGSGFDAPFDYYRTVGGDPAEQQSGAQLVRAVLRWADELVRKRDRARDLPYLLYVHFMDPHIDYRAPPRWLSKAARDYAGRIDGSAKDLHRRLNDGPEIDGEDREQLRRLYAAEVAYLDSEIRRLVTGLRKRGLVDDDTLIVISSDHGEQFAEHGGWEHGDLYIENVHVPLMMAGAGLDPGRVWRTLSALDLGPTVLEAAGLGRLQGAEGRGRLGSARSDDPGALSTGVWTEYGERTRLVIEPWILIEGRNESLALFDAEADPEERVDVSEDHPELVRALQERVRAHRNRDHDRNGTTARERTLDRETREALHELGYLW
ncbi:MAG: sulfatase [Myxococcota bacterium]